ncbi:MAG: heme-binding protein [Clostridia bacterium]|nr:heme-binding protein [Clostridia bacterium]
MSDIDYRQIMEITLQQEKLLRFSRFTNRDAWELGSFIVRRAADEMGIAMAVSIRKPNGNIVFQHCTDGTTMNNENWIRRKFNTVCLTEGCSLRAWASSIVKNQDLAAQGLDSKDYALCGGGSRSA